ncbi:efflux transporter outer membrane subunit [Pelagicoccus mobilis]|uniref:TolC family protein n=1 Tax=Pelagicoccus mobilis TaxID=415221 RepID=A0A934VLC4_9BACT|nr:TolC family protein [Pelagicoccus mobilis]MBK1877611.1 TolC family protein [Pelagicoccus mobilis]
MSARSIYAAIAFSLLLGGCETTPPPEGVEALNEALPDSTSVPDAFSSQVERPEGPLPANWIKSFDDAQLEAVVDEALANNLNLSAAASQVQAAAGLVTQAGSQMKPVIAAVGDGSHLEYDGGLSSDSGQGALSVSWELDIWGKLRSQRDAAEAQFEAVTSDYEYARLSLKAGVAKSWFTTVELKQQLAYASEVVDLYQQTLRIVETKHKFGDVGMKEVHLAKADLAASEERLKQVEGAEKTAVRSLEVLLGRYPSAELEVANEFAAVPPTIPVGLPSELIERRPDLVAAERRVAAAFNLTDAAKAARLPSIGLTAAGGASNNDFADLLGAGDGFWSVGANFLAPIYAGGALQAEVEISTAEQEAALALYGQKALVAFGEVENALSNEALLARREALLADQVDDSLKALELAQTEFKNGAIELLNVLQLQARYVSAKVAYISIKNARLAERIDLHLALGGDFSEE